MHKVDTLTCPVQTAHLLISVQKDPSLRNKLMVYF